VDCNCHFFSTNICYLRYMVLLDETPMETLVGSEGATVKPCQGTRAVLVRAVQNGPSGESNSHISAAGLVGIAGVHRGCASL
jgi:hypothetical protein